MTLLFQSAMRAEKIDADQSHFVVAVLSA